MSESLFNIDYITKLARLELTDEEKAEMGPQLSKVIEYVESLNSLNVDDIEATSHPFPMDNVVRDDTPGESLSQDEALMNAPHKGNGLFVVPKIVE